MRMPTGGPTEGAIILICASIGRRDRTYRARIVGRVTSGTGHKRLRGQDRPACDARDGSDACSKRHGVAVGDGQNPMNRTQGARCTRRPLVGAGRGAVTRLAVLLTLVAIMAVPLGFWSGPASAQVRCRAEPAGAPPRTVYRCGGGMVLEKEAAAAAGLAVTAQGDRTVDLTRGAVFVSVEPGTPAVSIRTPHAIASVRGTAFAIDVGRASTAVFVVEGSVDVLRVETGAIYVLGAGQGIDVPARGAASDPIALAVNRWGAARAATLLARFGR